MISRRRKRVIYGLFILILLLLVPAIIGQQRALKAGQATLYFSSPPSKLYFGQTFPLELRLSSLSTPVDAVGLVMKYDPRAFSIVKMSTDHSFCTFYTDNSFDTIRGEVHLSCGIPHPGFTGDSTLFTLQVRSKSVGNPTFQFDTAQTEVLADNGHGTHLRISPPTLTIPVVPST